MCRGTMRPNSAGTTENAYQQRRSGKLRAKAGFSIACTLGEINSTRKENIGYIIFHHSL